MTCRALPALICDVAVAGRLYHQGTPLIPKFPCL